MGTALPAGTRAGPPVHGEQQGREPLSPPHGAGPAGRPQAGGRAMWLAASSEAPEDSPVLQGVLLPYASWEDGQWPLVT